MILDKLNKAYPYKGSFNDSVSTFAFISIFISVFVYVFRINEIVPEADSYYKILISLYFGLVTFCAASFNTIILKLIVSRKTENNWQVWQEILLYILHFFTVSVALYFLKIVLSKDIQQYSHIDLFNSFSSTIVTGIIPVSIHILLEQNKLYKKYYEQAELIESDRQRRIPTETEETIVISDHTIPLSDILFFESSKNYVVLNLTNKESLTIRMTFKETEELLKGYKDFIRCHRAYIINMNKVEKVSGNAQGLKLSIENTSNIIPVSRTYITKVKHLLHN